MKKKLAFAGIIMAVCLLTACGGPKVSLEQAEKIATNDAGVEFSSVEFTHTKESTSNNETTYELVFSDDTTEWTYNLDGDGNILSSSSISAIAPALELADMGSADSNPIFDPYNLYNNVGVDQSSAMGQLTDENYSVFDESYDDRDLYIYHSGLSDSYVSSNMNYTQVHTEKGSTVPFRLSYINIYYDEDGSTDSYDRFAKDYEMIMNDLEKEYGAPVGTAYLSAEGDQTDYADKNELLEDLTNISSDGRWVCVQYEPDENHTIMMQGNYNGGDYDLLVDFY